ncbi:MULTISPECIES: hypothetical protein [Paraburkholderia]|uniref:Aconitase A/isopropylmalate dehydratase small subunit swivel domain-containing protein n=1 Tax=Paraburkholderia podalyriae TaxID=1938811 RepID=A0ABR7PVS4_9BURK|nr:hypothetical protein [Paraburkholderia podalyriae]MBC8750319.1 hypothetical protein [Paraburkholderia podalyriae]
MIAESFERIYRQNCHNLGIFTSTDFGLIDRIRRDEDIPLEEFTRGEDVLTAELIRRGGPFRLTEARRAGWRARLTAAGQRPMTYAEKIVARASGRAEVTSGQSVFARTVWRYAHEYVSPTSISFLRRE